MEIPKKYGVDLSILGLLKFYWDYQYCVAKSGNYHGETFVPYQGATQSGIVSPTLFNVIMDAVIWKLNVDVMEDVTVENTGLSGDNICCLVSLFYVGDGAFGSLNLEWLHNAN